jgi:hypothetical protein
MSDPHKTEEAASPSVIANNKVDAVVAAILVLIAGVVIFEARRLGAGWTSDGPGAGYFPFYIGIIILVSGLGILFQALFSKKRDTDSFVDREQLKRVFSVLLPAMVYVLGVSFLGLYLASAIYVALFMVLLGKYPVVKSVLISVAIIALFFMMFEVWFKVPLFKGTLDPLHFLGY